MSTGQAPLKSVQSEIQFLKLSIQYASIALVYYDYILTFPLEVRYMWRSKFSFSTILYIFTRYAMVANVLYLLAITSKLSKIYNSCDLWYRAIGSMSTIGRASVIFVFVARTYAIWNRNRYVLGTLGVLGLGCVVMDALHVPGLKCQGSSPGSQLRMQLPFTTDWCTCNLTFLDATLLSVLMCILELSVAVLTVYHAMRSSRLKAFRSQGLPGFVLRQGVLYFCGAFVFSASAMILNFVAKPDSFMIKLLNALILPFSCILTSRFLLHLRTYATGRPGDSLDESRSRLSSLNFGVLDEFARSDSASRDQEDDDGGEDRSEAAEDENGDVLVWGEDDQSPNAIASGSNCRIEHDNHQNSSLV
ncbi:hypothetical protein FPV67DRAFT_1666223 [Lyophyllum atratum]|nr:hypothetical protein FPV67DRAFT_1666223 [Lyophyllum atratum]